jgi:hypothetical protein
VGKGRSGAWQGERDREGEIGSDGICLDRQASLFVHMLVPIVPSTLCRGRSFCWLRIKAANVGVAHHVVLMRSRPTFQSDNSRSTCMLCRPSLKPCDKHVFHDLHPIILLYGVKTPLKRSFIPQLYAHNCVSTTIFDIASFRPHTSPCNTPQHGRCSSVAFSADMRAGLSLALSPHLLISSGRIDFSPEKAEEQAQRQAREVCPGNSSTIHAIKALRSVCVEDDRKDARGAIIDCARAFSHRRCALERYLTPEIR